MDAWRLIVDGPLDGALNMALDRAAQLAREHCAVPPTLRLYRWSRPTVTLGRFQSADGVDAQVAADAGVEIVRRFTGGRGVLHDDELTYSVIASVDDGVPRGVAASYRHLCAALVAAYGEMGVPDARLVERDRAALSSNACYLATTRADLAIDERKLAGSAQVWTGSTVLQHGSFTLTRDTLREAAVFTLSDRERCALESQTATLVDLLGNAPNRQQVEHAVVRGFERALGVRLIRGGWSGYEARLARSLREDTVVAIR